MRRVHRTAAQIPLDASAVPLFCQVMSRILSAVLAAITPVELA
jgi:hypothetical protein